MTAQARCSFCRTSTPKAGRVLKTPMAVDLLAGFADMRKVAVCQSCAVSFARATMTTRRPPDPDRDDVCQFCGQVPSGAILSGEGIATLCTNCAALCVETFDQYSEPVLNVVVCPRVFLSYSHESEKHKEWVIKLAAWLRHRRIAVLYDFDHIRNEHRTADTESIGLMIQKMPGCHAFMPVFTPMYLFSIGYGPRVEISNDRPDPQWAYDEFQLSLQLGSVRRIETIAVLRAGEMSALPPPFDASNTLDLRTSDALNEKLDRLSTYLRDERAVKVVPFLDDTLDDYTD